MPPKKDAKKTDKKLEVNIFYYILKGSNWNWWWNLNSEKISLIYFQIRN